LRLKEAQDQGRINSLLQNAIFWIIAELPVRSKYYFKDKIIVLGTERLENSWIWMELIINWPLTTICKLLTKISAKTLFWNLWIYTTTMKVWFLVIMWIIEEKWSLTQHFNAFYK